MEQKIDEVYNELFDFICDKHDDLHELKIIYKEKSTGKTIKRSWIFRERILSKLNE